MGHKCNSVLRMYRIQHNKGLAFRATKTKGNYDIPLDNFKDVISMLIALMFPEVVHHKQQPVTPAMKSIGLVPRY